MNLTSRQNAAYANQALAKSSVGNATPFYIQGAQVAYPASRLFLCVIFPVMVGRSGGACARRFLGTVVASRSTHHHIENATSLVMDYNTVSKEAIMATLSISSKQIRQLDGLYSLNDLHEASGGEKKHTPSRFIRSTHSQELVSEIEQNPNMGFGTALKAKQGGHNQGTWVCKELVYAYAMWISAKFHLHVIRAFDAMQSTPQNALVTLPDKYETELVRNYRKLRPSDQFAIQSTIHARLEGKRVKDQFFKSGNYLLHVDLDGSFYTIRLPGKAIAFTKENLIEEVKTQFKGDDADLIKRLINACVDKLVEVQG